MNTEILKNIFDSFLTDDEFVTAEVYGGGHINDTYRVKGKKDTYTLQRINTNVFKKPHEVMENISGVTEHIEKKLVGDGIDPSRRRLSVIKDRDGKPYYEGDEGFFRMFRFIDGVLTYRTLDDAEVFYKAARSFGRFQKMLSDYDADSLHETIPNFHNTPSRYADFCRAVKDDPMGRAKEVSAEIDYIHRYKDFYSVVTDRIADGSVPLRVTHNDTKLDNILFDNETKEGICIIDLDTVMPGSMLYDYGDSLRFGTNSAAEDEKDTSKIYSRLDFFSAFTRGFIEELGGVMTEAEFELLPIAGRLMTIECGMRFLADYISGDVYFKISHDGQNLDRARSQIALAEDMRLKEYEMCEIVRKFRVEYNV